MTESCENCRFWERKSPKHMEQPPYVGTNGYCRRYAPQGPVVKNNSHGWQLFPPMNHNEWCGDYRPSSIVENQQRNVA